MAKVVWHYLTTWLYDRISGNCVALAEALQMVSHDRLTSMLQGDWSGPILLERSFRTLFVWELSYVILDDAVIPKPFATAMESLAWILSTQARKPVSGFSLVWLVWTKGGPSKYQLGRALLSYARNRLRCRPEYVLFDA